MFAIIKIGGKQIKTQIGDHIWVEKQNANEGDVIAIKDVLMVDDKIGEPFIKNAVVSAVVLKQGKQKKIIVFKYKPKKNYHKKYGHRQPYTKLEIKNISLSGKVWVKPKTKLKINEKVDVNESIAEIK